MPAQFNVIHNFLPADTIFQALKRFEFELLKIFLSQHKNAKTSTGMSFSNDAKYKKNLQREWVSDGIMGLLLLIFVLKNEAGREESSIRERVRREKRLFSFRILRNPKH